MPGRKGAHPIGCISASGFLCALHRSSSSPAAHHLLIHDWSRESARDAFAKVNEFTIGRVVFEGIDVPVTPDAVVDVGAASAPANGNLVVDASINPRE